MSLQTFRNRLDFWIRPLRSLRTDEPDDFKVNFDGRALRYEDHLGAVDFSLDWAPGTCGVLSHCGTPTLELDGGKRRASAGPRYEIAARRAKEFLEWGGFDVQIFDPLTQARDEERVREEGYFADLLGEPKGAHTR